MVSKGSRERERQSGEGEYERETIFDTSDYFSMMLYWKEKKLKS